MDRNATDRPVLPFPRMPPSVIPEPKPPGRLAHAMGVVWWALGIVWWLWMVAAGLGLIYLLGGPFAVGFSVIVIGGYLGVVIAAEWVEARREAAWRQDQHEASDPEHEEEPR